jgi:hypothetical protein
MTATQESRPRARTVTGLPGGLPAMLEDPAAAHQIRISCDTNPGSTRLIVTCTCLGRRKGKGAGKGRPRAGIIEARTGTFPAAEAAAAWRGWHEQEGITL